MTLREAVRDKHNEAEKHCFVVSLLSGEMRPEVYATYLVNQAACYRALETAAQDHMADLPGLRRAELIELDAKELLGDHYGPALSPSTQRYVSYVKEVPSNLLWAHIYGRHFADLYGGQLIKRVAPGACRMYHFNDRSALIAKVRERLTDDLAEEANKVFDFAIALFDEVADAHNLRVA